MHILKNCTRIISLRNVKNKGVSSSYNQGIKTSNSKYYLIVNNDIVFRNDSVDNLLKFARSKDYGMVTVVDTLRCFKTDYLSFQIEEKEWEGLCNSCFILKDWVIDKVGFYDEAYWPAYCEDLDYLHRMSVYGIEKKSTFTSVVKHDEGSTGRTNNWKLGESCNTPSELYHHAYVKNKGYYATKFKLGNQFNSPINQ